MHVQVTNGNMKQALRVLRSKLLKDGQHRELRDRRFHMSRSQKRRLKAHRAENKRRRKTNKVKRRRARAQARPRTSDRR